MKIIDGHAHAWEPGDLNLLNDRLISLDGAMDDGDPHKWSLRFNGSLQSLLAAEAEAGMERFVLLSISARPDRCRILTEGAAAAALEHPEIIPFGSVHPDSSDIEGDVAAVVELGMKGVKLHSLVQRFNPLSDKARRLYRLLEDNGLVLLMDSMDLSGAARFKPHLGFMVKPAQAIGFETNPEVIARVAAEFPRLRLIAAHMGCCYGWDRLDPLYDLDQVWFDMAYVHRLMTVEQAMDIIRRKGSDRVIFGSDAPWRNPANALNWTLALPLSDDERRMILADNLLGLLEE